MTITELEPQPRIDTLVRRPDGSEARRTEYAGAVWLNGKPVIAGMVLHRTNAGPRGIQSVNFEVPFYLPDSLPYVADRLGDAVLSVSVALRGSGEIGALVAASADFAPDPSGTPTWIRLQVTGHVGWPRGVDYRVVALTAVDAVVPGA